MKAATCRRFKCSLESVVSIHAAREGGDLLLALFVKFLAISIHAAREGGDTAQTSSAISRSISIHAAREGGDPVR